MIAIPVVVALQTATAVGSFTNGDFETGVSSPWNGYGTGVSMDYPKSGSFSMYIEGSQEAVQTVTGLSPNSTYELKASVLVGAEGDEIVVGARNYGGTISDSSTNTTHTQLIVQFTTGSGNTSADLFISRGNPGAWSWGYVDDISLTLIDEGAPGDTGPSLVNGNFEAGDLTGWAGDAIGVVNWYPYEGSYHLYLEGGREATQTIEGLSPNTTYTLSAYLWVGGGNDVCEIGARNHGGSEVSSSTTNDYGTLVSVTFTTGSFNTSAEIFISRRISGNWYWGFADSVMLETVVEDPVDVPPLVNGNFESGDLAGWEGDAVGVVNWFPYEGTYHLYLEGGREAVQTIEGLSPNTTYTLSAYLWVGGGNDVCEIGARDFGGSEVASSTTNDYGTLVSVTFTTGSSNTSAEIFISRRISGNWFWGFADDVILDIGESESDDGDDGDEPGVPSFLHNGDFETGDTSGWAGLDIGVADWFAREGVYHLFVPSGTEATQVVTGLEPDTTYTLGGFIWVGGGYDVCEMGVRGFGGSPVSVSTINDYNTYKTVTFTTGSTDTAVEVFISRSIVGNDYWGFADGLTLILGEAEAVGSGELVFSDEFDGTSLDSSKWNVGWPWGNFADHADEIIRPENITVNDGVLKITAEREGDQWYSGLIQTNGMFNKQYGTWEARIKAVNTPGFLSAFWSATNEGWPPEIDFMEVLGNNPYQAHFTQHFNHPNGQYGVNGYELEAGTDLSAGWHVYRCVWDSRNTSFFIDGKHVVTFTSQVHEPLYLLLNLHVGMDWTGDPDPDNYEPESMYVDWVRVYDGVPSPVEGDLNGDSKVTRRDLFEMRSLFRKRSSDEGFRPEADLDRDGHITFRDYRALLRLFRSSHSRR